MAATSGSRGRPRGFDRAQALDVALRAFWTHGFQATSVAELTSAMGISAPSLYAAFGDKRALFREVVEEYRRRHGASTMRALAEAPDARTGVAAMLRQAAADYTDPGSPPGCLIITAATNCGPDSADVERSLRNLRNGNVAEIERRIRSDVDTGALPPHTDATALATFTSAILQGMSHQARDGADRAQLEAVAELAMRAWPPPVEAPPIGDKSNPR